MAGELRKYTEFVHASACRLCGCPPRSQQHHKCEGPTVAPGEREPMDKRLGGKRGKSQTAHDFFSLSVCIKCHHDVQTLSGRCLGWTKRQRAEWEDAQIADQHTAFDTWLKERNELDDMPALAGHPVPSSVDVVDVESAADSFVAEYPVLGLQGRHDLARLLVSVVKATREGRIST